MTINNTHSITTRGGLIASTLMLLTITFGAHSIVAGSATWKTNANSGDWNSATNWTPQTVPNGAGDKATFATSSTTNISISAVTEVDTITFRAGANPFTIADSNDLAYLSIDGAGIKNNSGITQSFLTTTSASGSHGSITFRVNASAGKNTTFTNQGAIAPGAGGTTLFLENASAQQSTFNNQGATIAGGLGGVSQFSTGSIGNSVFKNYGGTVPGASGGRTPLGFLGQTLVGAPTFEIYGGTNGGNGGQVLFAGEVSAPRGIVKFLGLSDFGNLDISWHSPLGAAIKSVTGGGYLLLGANNLMISSGALAAGGIQDGGSAGGTGGSLTKTSSGMLQLAPNLTNTYTGGTTILEGVLTLLGGTMSATGPGPVQVSGGTLSGLGIIAGSLTIGTGSGTGASLQPSGAKPNGNGGFTVQSPLNFQADATYVCDVFTNLPSASRVIAAGVTIQNGAQLSLLTHSSNTIPLGRTFTIIGNTTAAPISGTFSNLPDGVILTAGPNKFQADYQGSDGNDLTLTVVP